MHKFSVSFILLCIAWILFTSSTNVLEVSAGFIVSVLIALLCKEFMFYEPPYKLFNPVVWLNTLVYFLIFLYVEVQSHLDVAYRVITGRINPAIVKVPTKLTSDVGRTLLANSITMTPGTLTVGIDKDLYVHWIGFNKGEKIGELFEKYALGVVK